MPLNAAVKNYSEANLSHYINSLSATVGGSVNTKILCIGDSTTVGCGDGATLFSGAQLRAWPTRLAAELFNGSSSSWFGDGNASAFSNAITDTDARITVSGYASDTVTDSIGAHQLITSTTGTIAFTPTNQIDTIDIWYSSDATYGVLNVNVDGGSSLGTISETSGGFAKATFTCSLGSHTINVGFNSGTKGTLCGMAARNSAKKELSVYNAGWAGGVASDYVRNTYSQSELNAVGVIAPDLTLVMPGINDWDAGTNLTSYQSSLQTLITKAKLSGSVILITPPPTNAGANPATQSTYNAVVSSLAVSNNLVWVDVWNTFGGTWNASLMINTVHPNATGYQLIADTLVDLLNNPSQTTGGKLLLRN